MIKGSQRKSIIDMLKGIAILFIVVTHFPWTDSERLIFLFPYWIGMAVPIFMVLSGYVSSLSFERKNVDHLEELYSKEYLIKRSIRYTVPFVFVYVVEQVLFCLIGKQYSAYERFIMFFTGGIGPGSYYFPIMIQFIFYVPVIYFLIKKYDKKGLVWCAVINLIYEVLVTAYTMNYDCYRLLIFRYTLAIAFGCFFAIGRKQFSAKVLIGFGAIGALYLYLIDYQKIIPPLLSYWRDTNLFSILWIVPLLSYLLRYQAEVKAFPIEIIGRASYNIFYIQMMFYMGTDYFYKYVPNRLFQFMGSVVACLIIGLLFYIIENKVTNSIMLKINRLKIGEE